MKYISGTLVMNISFSNYHQKLYWDAKQISDEYTPAEQAAAATTITAAAAAAVAPPPINLFPPQGAPQPGFVSAGGGITPAVALTVKHPNYCWNQSGIKYKINHISDWFYFLNSYSHQ